MATKTEISNLAISHLGIGKEISNFDTDKSEEAQACRRFYEIAKEATLADLDWTFATKFADLNLVKEDPTNEWNYSYRYPSDCLILRRILSGIRYDTNSSRIPYRVVKDEAGKLIFTDQRNACVEYTQNITNSSLHSADFNLALSFRLASYIAARLTGGDPFKLKQEMIGQYDLELGKAKKRNMGEETPEPMPESDLIRARNGQNLSDPRADRYFDY